MTPLGMPVTRRPGVRSGGEARHWPIRTVLVCLVLACLLPGVVGAIAFFIHDYRQGRAQLEKDTILTARALVQTVDSYLQKAQAVGEILSTDESLAQGNFEVFRQRAQEALTRTRVGSNIILLDESAKQVMNLQQKPGAEPLRSPRPDAVRQVFATGQAVLLDIFVAPFFKRPATAVYLPVMHGGKVVYVLSIAMLPEQFSAILQQQSLPPEWVAAIFDSKGTIVARTQGEDQFVGQKGSQDYIERILSAREGSVESVTREGIPVQSSFSRSPVTGWTVGIGIPRRVLEAELTRNLSLFAVAAAGLLGMGLGLAWYLSGGIARSVKMLTLGLGNRAASRQFEIKELADAAELLRERTAALEETNQSLMVRERELLEAHRLARFGNWYWDVASDRTMVSQSLEELYGRDIPPFAEQRGTLLTVESWERARLLADKAVEAGDGYEAELEVICGDGSILWIHVKCEAVRGGNGEVIALRGTAQDITERKRTLLAMHQSKALFQAVFEQAAVGIAQVALNGYWLQVNDKLCSILGYSREELLSVRFQDITYPSDLETDLAAAERLLARAMPGYTLEKRYIRKDGSRVWVGLTVSLVRSADGAPDYFIAVVEDIQGRKDAEAELEAARHNHLLRLEQQVADRTAALQEARDNLEQRVAERTEEVRRLAAEVTYAEEKERQALARDLHDELGQVLHILKIKLELLEREALSAEGRSVVEEAGPLIEAACSQVRSLTSNLSPPILSTLGLPAALRWLSGEIRQTYDLAVSCHAELPDCVLSSAQAAVLFRVARELLINVAKHSGCDFACLELVRAGAALTMKVMDSGRGIASLDEAMAGTKGFGLASARERISYLGGTMKIETAPGDGVRVEITMPLETRPAVSEVQG